MKGESYNVKSPAKLCLADIVSVRPIRCIVLAINGANFD